MQRRENADTAPADAAAAASAAAAYYVYNSDNKSQILDL